MAWSRLRRAGRQIIEHHWIRRSLCSTSSLVDTRQVSIAGKVLRLVYHHEGHPVQYRCGDLVQDWSRKDTEINSGANDKYDSPILFIHEDQNGATYGRDGSWDLGVY